MENYTSYTDEQLLEWLRQGKSEITEYLLEKYKPLVRKKANAMYLIGGENEDLIQEGMIGLFKAVRDYRPDRETSFYHFADLCISRQLYTAIKSSNRRYNEPLNTSISLYEEGADGIWLVDNLTDHDTNPEQLVIEQEYWRNFQSILVKKLSKMEQQVLNLYLEGCNYTQIAEKMSKSSKSIDNALQRIRQKIRMLSEKVGD